jgi:hypothetical protein
MCGHVAICVSEKSSRDIMQLQDFYNLNDDGAGSFTGSQVLRGQIFIPSKDYAAALIKLKLYANDNSRPTNNPGVINVYIESVNAGTGKPTNTVLGSGTYNGDMLGHVSPGEFVEIPLAATVSLTTGVKYAVVMGVPGSSSSASVSWRMDVVSPNKYGTASTVSSSNLGTTWSTGTNQTYMFEIYSEDELVVVEGISDYE